jgi:hypothetical protein
MAIAFLPAFTVFCLSAGSLHGPQLCFIDPLFLLNLALPKISLPLLSHISTGSTDSSRIYIKAVFFVFYFFFSFDMSDRGYSVRDSTKSLFMRLKKNRGKK